MGALEKRLEALEAVQDAQNGHVVVYTTESRPGLFWHLETPDDVFGQDRVDELSKTKNVIIVQYVAKGMNHE